MDSCRFGGSNLESSALETALRRRLDKKSNHQRRNRPLLQRANAIRQQAEINSLRPLSVHVPQSPSASRVKKEKVESHNNDALVLNSETPGLTKGLTFDESHNFDDDNEEDNLNLALEPVTLPLAHEPVSLPALSSSLDDMPPTNEDASLALTNSTGQPLLDSDDVQKYFGYSALNSFNQKVSFVNKQKNLIVKCPPLDFHGLPTSSTTSRCSTSGSNSLTSRSRMLLGSASESSQGRTGSSRSKRRPQAGPTYRPQIRSRMGRHLVRSHSKKYDQLADGSVTSESVVVDDDNNDEAAAAACEDTRKMSFFFQDDCSFMSDVTGAFGGVEFVEDPLREKRAALLSQELFTDTSNDKGPKDQEDSEYHIVETRNLEPVCASPRSAYIMGCLSDNLNPRGSHIVRKKITDELHLEHYGMGDDLIEHLSTALQFLPHVKYVNIADNNLTDWGLASVLGTLLNVKNLLILDMSQNMIGVDTADALASYLRSDPLLQNLILSKTDIDDLEGEMFVKALHHSTHLIELDLSMNQLGNQEVLNSVRPNTTTAPEELANLLGQRYCPLQALNLSWNVIRLESAAALAQSLAVNESLTFLDLSYNCIGPEGGKMIGESLFDNRTLQTLLLANNNIDAPSCFIICASIQQNYSLRRLCMDGNPVGELGAKSLMKIPTALGSRLVLSADNCNVKFRRQENSWFDEDDPCGKYCLDLSDSFSRAVAMKILIIAAEHYSFGIKKCTYAEKKESKEEAIVLEQTITHEKSDYMTLKEKKVLQNLYKLQDSSKDLNVLKELFNEYDFNKSGTLEHFELKILLDDLGMELADNQTENAMIFIDMDKSGSIDLSEFVTFMEQFREYVENRVHDMTEGVVMSVLEPLPKSRRESTESDDDTEDDVPCEPVKKRYIPPKSGFLRVELADTYIKKAKFNIITEINCQNIISIATKIGHVTTMIAYSLHSAKLRFNEALMFFNVMFDDIGNKADVLFILLPRMLYPMEAHILQSRVTNEDPVEIGFVKQKLGYALRPIFGIPCGFYSLDISKPSDRICLVKLFECNMESMLMRKRLKSSSLVELGLDMAGDTSQQRNWSCFRNEVFNGTPFKISPDLFYPFPSEGRLEFDFVVHDQPPVEVQAITDQKLTQILINSSLLRIEDKAENFEALHQCQQLTNKCQKANGRVLYSCDKEIAAEIAAASCEFQERLLSRSDYLQEGVKREEIKVDYVSHARRVPMLRRHVSMTNNDHLMTHKDNHESFSGEPNSSSVEASAVASASAVPDAKTFDDKFKEFINRPLGAQQLLLLKQKMTGMSEEAAVTQQDDISEICCNSKYSRTAVLIRKGKKSSSTPSAKSSLPSSSTKLKDKSRKGGETITLPSIVVTKNDKTFVLPALTIAREEDNEEKEEEKTALDLFSSDKNSSGKFSSLQARRPGLGSTSDVSNGNKNLSAEYGEHQKRVQLLTKNRRRMRGLAEAVCVSEHAKASRLLSMLVHFLGMYYLQCRHIANVLQRFVIGFQDKAEYFGTYRVELVVTLFSKIVDIHNFDVIFKEMDPKEQGCLYSRLGWMNLYNPTRPERSYELNMEMWEERMVAKSLLSLAEVEEGDNISNADFRWSRQVDRMPGWLVTKPWLQESSMQRKGLLSLTYVSSDVDYKLVPNVPFRKSLLNMVLSCERLMLLEVDSAAAGKNSKSRLEGEIRMLEDADLWTSYFYGDKDILSKISQLTSCQN